MTLKDNLIMFTLNLERCQGLPHVNKQCSGDLTVLWEQLLCLYIYLTNIANMNILIYSPKLHSAPVNVTSAVVCRHDLYTSLPFVDPAAPAETRSWHKNCITQTTSWSPCSKTCGRGLSLRISNANEQCELLKESRLCNLRPCEVDITKHIKVALLSLQQLYDTNWIFKKCSQAWPLSSLFLHQPGKKCLNIYREDQPSNLTISGCTSTKPYRPKYCGMCTDERCCIPYKSKTIDVEFECPNGTGFTWKMMWVQACFCNLSCKNPNDIFSELESYYGYPEVMN